MDRAGLSPQEQAAAERVLGATPLADDAGEGSFVEHANGRRVALVEASVGDQRDFQPPPAPRVGRVVGGPAAGGGTSWRTTSLPVPGARGVPGGGGLGHRWHGPRRAHVERWLASAPPPPAPWRAGHLPGQRAASVPDGGYTGLCRTPSTRWCGLTACPACSCAPAARVARVGQPGVRPARVPLVPTRRNWPLSPRRWSRAATRSRSCSLVRLAG